MATNAHVPYCSAKPRPLPPLPAGLPEPRERAILRGNSKWVNGTVLHYTFFDDEPAFAGDEAQRDVVRGAFQEWKDVGIGLEFEEIADRSEAEVRIGFLDGDGSWSYVGRDVLRQGAQDRTMNFGWDLTTDYGHTTARHEIGHTLGMPHEHQNPFAGIVWDEERVYAELAEPPNSWSREETFHNILRKLSPSEVEGSRWDPDSVMEYDFGPGLIVEPVQYQGGIHPPGTLSDTDREFARRWYPAGPPAPRALQPFRSTALQLKEGEQADFELVPDASRDYTLQTFGTADTVLVLFEDVDGQLRFLAGDDDGGADRNATLTARLLKGRRYVLRVRVYWVGASGTTGVMYW